MFNTNSNKYYSNGIYSNTNKKCIRVYSYRVIRSNIFRKMPLLVIISSFLPKFLEAYKKYEKKKFS